MINNVLNYIRQHPQLNEHQPHHYLQPPTQYQFCLESTNVRSSCDEQPAVMCILVSTQHLHSLDTSTLVQPRRLEKKKKDAGLPQVSACQNAFKPEGNHSRPAGAECWLMTSYNPTLPLSHPLASLLHSTSFCAFFTYQHFWFSQTVWKEGRGSTIIFPRSMRVKLFLELEGNHSRTSGADWWPATSQHSRLAILWHPFYISHPTAHSLGTSIFGSTKPFGKKDAGL